MMHEDTSGIAIRPQLLPLQRLADARRVLEVGLDDHPFIDAEGRQAIRQAKRIAWAVIAEVCEELVSTLDIAAGDPDLEFGGDEADGNGSEDDFMLHGHNGPGCPIADSDAAVDDFNCDEPTQDLEEEEGVAVCHTGIDQTRPIGPSNPALV